tara:strand:- start:915 stop:1307 length:393 start_codon:yes stop_codon:yes gene_type:complete
VNKKQRNRGNVSVIASKQWDPSIKKGDLVVNQLDFPSLNIWKVFRVDRRVLYPEDMFNYPGLVDRGMSQGDEYCPLVFIRLYRRAPHLERVGPPAQEKSIDGYLLERILKTDLDPIIENLKNLQKEVEDQ